MSTRAMGPGAGARWQTVQAPYIANPSQSQQPRAVLLAADVGNERVDGTGQARVYHALPEHPFVSRDSGRRPVFSLTLILSRMPAVHEDSVHHLIQQGIVSFDLRLQLPAAVLAAVSSAPELVHNGGAVDVRQLFVRQARFKLHDKDALITTASSTAGTVAGASLQATLDREQALELLAALDGGATSLRLTSEVTYRVSGTTRRRLSGDWLDIYDFVAQRINAAEPVTRNQVHGLFDQMVGSGVLVTNTNGAGPSTRLFDAFMRQSIIILERRTPHLLSVDPQNTYTLRARPNAGFRLQHEEEFSGDSLEALTIATPIATLLNGLLEGQDRDAFIKLVVFSAGGSENNGSGGLVVPPRPQRFVDHGGPRWAGDPETRRSPAHPSDEKIAMAMTDGALQSVALRLRPEMASAAAANGNAQTMIASGVAKVVSNSGAQVGRNRIDWELNDWRVANKTKERLQHLPVVENPGDPIWPDRIDANKFWYAPVFELLRPALDEDPSRSPFRFSFRRVGETGSGPALEGEIQFTLRRAMSNRTLEALRARRNPSASPVPTKNLAVSLVLPFINSDDNALTRHTCPCEVSFDGDNVIAKVVLATNWVRIAYTVLSNPSASREPARLSIAFAYEAYTKKLRHSNVNLVFGNKAAKIPLVFSDAQRQRIQDEMFLDASTATLNFAHGAVVFKREERGDLLTARARPRPPGEIIEIEDEPRPRPRPRPGGPVANPPVQPEVDVSEILESTLARRTLLRQEQHDTVFACNVFGAFYRDTSDGDDVAVGCRQALELGQVSYRRYEHLPQLDTAVNGEPVFQVFRSLQQPGRFLVLPARYAFTRHAPESPDAYKPRMLVYRDTSRATNAPIVFIADLEPDIDLYLRRNLDLKLAQLARKPIVEYPTAIESTMDLRFHAMESTPVTTVRGPDSFSVSISANADTDWPLLITRLQTGGVLGQVTFKLGDGSELSSQLTMDLRRITGPWSSGAVTVEKVGNAVRLTNRIDRPVSVHDLMVVSDGRSRLIPIERVIAAQVAETIAVEPLPAPVELYPVYITPSTPEALKEIPNAIERIHVNVPFLNLILFSAHNLTLMNVLVRRAGSDASELIQFTATSDTSVDFDLQLPLTEHVAEPTIQLRIVKTFSNGTTAVKEWFDWNLTKEGFVVSLTWDFVQ